MLDGIGGYAGTLGNSIVINSINVTKDNPTCYFIQFKGVLSIQTDKVIIFEYNNIEQLIKSMGEILGIDDSNMNLMIENFYTKFKKVTYNRVLEKIKSLIPA